MRRTPIAAVSDSFECSSESPCAQVNDGGGETEHRGREARKKRRDRAGAFASAAFLGVRGPRNQIGRERQIARRLEPGAWIFLEAMLHDLRQRARDGAGAIG
jgi:hypothetical protein